VNPRVLALIGTVVVFGGVITVTQVSSAQSRRANYAAAKAQQVAANQQGAACARAPASGANGERITTDMQNGRVVRNHWDDGGVCPAGGTGASAAGKAGASAPGKASASATGKAGAGASSKPAAKPSRKRGKGGNAGASGGANASASAGASDSASASAGASDSASASAPPALEIISNSCKDSKLQPHDGFQKGDRCVSTDFGDVGAAATNPSLLITQAPQKVGVNQAFTIKVSTRNLVRDRFLAAGKGGYYVERSLLNAQGLVRGHFHTACRMLASTNAAPDPAPVPAFFVATEDGAGGATPDVVNVQVTGMPAAGEAQCAVWAGDASHRIPMMERANQTPAFDAVRVKVG
jgi:hypothetical protein